MAITVDLQIAPNTTFELTNGGFVSVPIDFSQLPDLENRQKETEEILKNLKFEILLEGDDTADDNSSFTKRRARIFYGGLNRNRTFFT